MLKTSFLNALGTLIYIVLVALLMQNSEVIFGEMESIIGPIAFLLLFTLSAIVVGGLVLGRPIMFYLDGKKRESVKLFLMTSAWLAGFMILALIIALLIK